ncbi:hypothetical protein DPMN_090906 [Dreissena polymorpha]|uniref:Uncharacterized protein n=1 Tax=Dreissena polymorpha TaxID=45954 RepID=A0A9D4KZM0_DREPO|nr:hypothetical protein DPMN_090906 [Dreissena polymorpha]
MKMTGAYNHRRAPKSTLYERKGLHVPYNVRWYGQGGLRTDRMDTDLYGKMLKEKEDMSS